MWRGGRTVNQDGYVLLREKTHPNATKKGLVFEHVKVMSAMIGRPLLPGETVHHLNGVRDDNRPENLELWSSNHPKGQRIVNKIEWCLQFLRQYAPEKPRDFA